MTEAKAPCPVCGRWENRAAVVDGVVVRGEDVLLIRRGTEPERGKYALPGGYMDRDETAEEACVREVREETGLDVRVIAFLAYYDRPERDPRRQNVALAFLTEPMGGELRAGDDADDAGWFALDRLPALAFDHARILADARAFLRRSAP